MTIKPFEVNIMDEVSEFLQSAIIAPFQQARHPGGTTECVLVLKRTPWLFLLLIEEFGHRG